MGLQPELYICIFYVKSIVYLSLSGAGIFLRIFFFVSSRKSSLPQNQNESYSGYRIAVFCRFGGNELPFFSIIFFGGKDGKCLQNSVEDTFGYMYTQFGGDRSIFHRLDTFSVENRVPKKRRAIRAKWSFFGRKSANFQNFSKSFQNLIKPIEIHIWSKNQLI